MTHTITNDDDIIDSRDIIERIEELKEMRADMLEEAKETGCAKGVWETTEEAIELEALQALAEQGESESSDWGHGETLIHRRYWFDYVQELLSDCGDIPRDLPHYIEIDWDATANNIEADYASVDFDGVEYLIRSC